MREYDPASVFGFAVNGLLIFTSVGTMIYGHKLSYLNRIAGGYLVIAALMIALPLITNALDSGPAFWADIGILVLFGMAGGIVQASTFAIGGMLPGKYMGGIMLGNGLSGIALNLVRVITLLAIPDDFYTGALVYFILAACILLICAVTFLRFIKMDFVQYYVKKASEEKMRTHRRISGVNEEFYRDALADPLVSSDINKSVASHLSNKPAGGNNYLPVPTDQTPPQT